MGGKVTKSKEIWRMHKELESNLKEAQRQCDEAMSGASEGSSSLSRTASQKSQQSTDAGSKSSSSQTSIFDLQKEKLDTMAEILLDCASNIEQGDLKTDGIAHSFVLEIWTRLKSGLSAEIESLKGEINTSQVTLNTTPGLRRVDSFMSSSTPSLKTIVATTLNPETLSNKLNAVYSIDTQGKSRESEILPGAEESEWGILPALVTDGRHSAPDSNLVQLVIHIGFQVISVHLSGTQALPKPTSRKCFVIESHPGRVVAHLFMKNDMWLTRMRKKLGKHVERSFLAFQILSDLPGKEIAPNTYKQEEVMTSTQRKDEVIAFRMHPDFQLDGRLQSYIYYRKILHENLETDTIKTLYEKGDPGIFREAQRQESLLASELASLPN